MPVTRVSSGPSPVQVRRPQNRTYQQHDTLVGCILWLPTKDRIDHRLLVGVDIDDGCFNHPVVVLSTDLAEGKAIILIVSVLSCLLITQLTSEANFP